MRVAVVGGGISGLAAAWALRYRAEVTVFEPGPLGGKLQTENFGGHPVDTGPDAFIARVPHAVDLCTELGLAGELVAPAAGQALLWSGGCLRPLPEGLVLGAPGRLGPLVGSGLLSPLGLARAGLDLVLPRTRWPADLAVSDLIGRRFGRQVAERLVDPLLGGIHAGSIVDLSAQATAPQLLEAARRSRSLLVGLRRAPGPPAGPLFLAPRGGMHVLVERLVAGLCDRGVTFASLAVSGIHGEKGGRVWLDPGGPFDRTVLAVPAAAAAKLVNAACPDAADELAAIRTASVAVVTLGYPASDLRLPTGASGMLVPRAEGRLMTACSFGSSKWPHWSDPGTMVLRVSTGRAGDDRPFQLDDDQLVERVHGEVAQALGARAFPSARRVSRWPGSFPQYEVGHLARVDRIEATLRRTLPGVALAGASYRGSGIPACIASGRAAADSMLPPAGDGDM